MSEIPGYAKHTISSLNKSVEPPNNNNEATAKPAKKVPPTTESGLRNVSALPTPSGNSSAGNPAPSTPVSSFRDGNPPSSGIAAAANGPAEQQQSERQVTRSNSTADLLAKADELGARFDKFADAAEALLGAARVVSNGFNRDKNM